MNIIYNSFNEKYKILIKKNFLIKNDQNYALMDSSSLLAEDLILMEYEDYYELNLYYPIQQNKEYLQKVKENYNILIDELNMSKYKTYSFYNSLKVFLNKSDLNFSVDILDISDTNLVLTNEHIIISVIFEKENISIKYDGYTSVKINEVNKFFTRNILSDNEKDFIIYAYQHKDDKIKTVLNKFDKDTSNFKDFMEKDPNVISKFKITKQELKIFNPNTLNILDGLNNSNDEINRLIGLDAVKTQLLQLNAKLNYKIKRESRNIYDVSNQNLHMCFYGNPGTGKTTVARIMTGLLFNMGYIKKNKCIEVNANDLKGNEVGHTAIKTKVILRNCADQVLFIDEAYALFDKQGFGKEAIDTIIKEMEDNKTHLVVIFAGYKKEMEDFIEINEGLRSRISKYILFEDYSTIQLGKIFLNFLKQRKLNITTDALIKSMLFFKLQSYKENFANGRFIRNYVEELEEEHAFNTQTIEDAERLSTITIDDITETLLEKLSVNNVSKK